VPHKLVVMKTLEAWEDDEEGELSDMQRTVRQHYHMHVWLNIDNTTDQKSLVPPKGTWMHIDPEEQYAMTYRWSPREKNCDSDTSSTLLTTQ
jgi:hypothetical protein